MNDQPIVKNAVTCGICGAPADRYAYGFQCQKNPNHMGDLNVGIFSDLTPPDTSVLKELVIANSQVGKSVFGGWHVLKSLKGIL